MKLIKMILVVLITLLIMSPAITAFKLEKIYFLGLEYDKGALKLLDMSLITGNPTLSKDTSLPYKLELLSINKEILYEGFFDIPNKFFAPPPLDPEEKSGIIELDYVEFSLSLPYYKNGNLIKITKDKKELLIIDVLKFSIYCGDGKCQSDETPQNCPQDCKLEEEPKSLTTEELTRPFEGEEQQKDKSYYLWIIIPIIFLAILLIIFFIFKRRKLETSNLKFSKPKLPPSPSGSPPTKISKSPKPSTGSKFRL